MGCDIHLYIEYKNKKVAFDGYKDNWHSFGQRINPGRNYAMFALMATRLCLSLTVLETFREIGLLGSTHSWWPQPSTCTT